MRSRRIHEANRLVYAADEVALTVVSCRYRC
ncbi:MAG: type II toxin-antitoxin system YoeB family toxin [Thiocapsa sp.]|nr:type II toxin-antitoxin system YoeB family toxin [Thiocapsa sp.]